jgi:hypothetical protein
LVGALLAGAGELEAEAGLVVAGVFAAGLAGVAAGAGAPAPCFAGGKGFCLGRKVIRI